MDVFLMIRRNKTTIFADAKETTTVFEVKKMIEGILKKAPEDQRLYKISKEQHIAMEDSKPLSDYGYTHSSARAQLPEAIGLVYRTGENDDDFEPLEITAVSTPPDLPDVMKTESHVSNNAQSNSETTA